MDADEPVAAREVIARLYKPPPKTMQSCGQHAALPIDKRPHECSLCYSDLVYAARELSERVEFLSRWRDDAIDVLARQDAALGLLQGWSPRQHSVGELTDLCRPSIDGPGAAIAEDLTPQAADAIVAFLEHVLETADGTTGIAAE